jgi:hypothetical protein
VVEREVNTVEEPNGGLLPGESLRGLTFMKLIAEFYDCSPNIIKLLT